MVETVHWLRKITKPRSRGTVQSGARGDDFTAILILSLLGSLSLYSRLDKDGSGIPNI